MEIALDHFRGWKVPEDLTNVHEYMKVLTALPFLNKSKHRIPEYQASCIIISENLTHPLLTVDNWNSAVPHSNAQKEFYLSNLTGCFIISVGFSFTSMP